MGGQNQGGIALLGDPDQRGWLVETFDDAIGDQQAFIDHEIEPHSARGKSGDDGFCAAFARDLLVMTKGEIDGPLRAKALLGHYFGGFQHRIEVALVVPGAAAPDKPVGDDPIERRLLPVVLGTGRDGHHVLMGEQSDR